MPDREHNFRLLATQEDKQNDDGASTRPISLLSFKISHLPDQLVQAYSSTPGSYLNKFLSSHYSQENFHIIVSTASGLRRAEAFWKQALLPFLDAVSPPKRPANYELHLTSSEQSVTELACNVLLPAANQGKEQLVIVLSGDGGVIDVVNALLSAPHDAQYRHPVLALLPMGTGNALANSSGILGDPSLGLKTLLNGKPQELPLFRATFSSGAKHLTDEGKHEAPLQVVDRTPTVFGAVVCSWGMHAALVADSDTTEYRKFGAERFKMAAKEALFPSDNSLPHAYRGRLSILRPDGDSWEKIDRSDHGYVLSTLVSNLETGFTISPHSRPLDGVLRVIHFSAMAGKDVMDIMGGAYQGGKHIDDPRIGYESVAGLRIDFEEDDPHWRRVCVDGKIIRVEKGGWVEVRTDVKPILDLIVV